MIRINDRVWYIKFVTKGNKMLIRRDGSLSIGACDNNTSTIYIDSSLKGRLLKKVLCHELTHAAMFSFNIHVSYEQEEILADLIATYGEEIITITNFLFKKLKGEA